jgi:trehalose-6-phosphate synthase
VLSEFAGAAERLGEAIVVNPYDPSRIAEAIRRGFCMKATERRAAMVAMRERVLAEDVDWWVGWFLATAATCGKPKSKPRRARRR